MDEGEAQIVSFMNISFVKRGVHCVWKNCSVNTSTVVAVVLRQG